MYILVRFVEDSVWFVANQKFVQKTSEGDYVNVKYIDGNYYPAIFITEGELGLLNELKRQLKNSDEKVKALRGKLWPGKTARLTSTTFIEEYDPAKPLANIFSEATVANIPAATSVQTTPIRTPQKSISGIPADTTSLGITIPTKAIQGKYKQYFCIFCEKLVSRFARHLVTKHGNEQQVQLFSTLATNSQERKDMVAKIRLQGTQIYNTDPQFNKGDLIVSRRSRILKKDQNYVMCTICGLFVSPRTLPRHYRICGKILKTERVPRGIAAQSRAIVSSQYIPGAERLKNDVLSTMHVDDIYHIIIKDTLILEYGNYLCTRHETEKHLNSMIRQKLRQIGRFFKEYMKLDPAIGELKEIYKPAKFNIFMDAVRKLSGHADGGSFQTASIVNSTGFAVKLCGMEYRCECIRNANKLIKNEIDEWMDLYKHEFYTKVGKTALKAVARKKWNKPQLLPVTGDILKLGNYLKEHFHANYKKLEIKFCKQMWTNLSKIILLQILVFNRRRVGETSKIFITDFDNRHSIQEGSEVYKSLNRAEQIISSRYMRIEVRGKLGRPVSVLISILQIEGISLLLKYRQESGVTTENPFLFGKGSSYFDGCVCLREAALNCGAMEPQLITGTKLRKHIATLSQIMNFTENDMGVLSDFMGHNIAVHREFYRLPNEVTHLAKLSQVLIAVDDGRINELKGKTLNEIEILLSEDQDVDYNFAVPSADLNINAAKRKLFSTPSTSTATRTFDPAIPSTSKATSSYQIVDQIQESFSNPIDTPKKKPNKDTPRKVVVKQYWISPERLAVNQYFGDFIENCRLPSVLKICDVRRMEGPLQNRTVSQIKSFIQNAIKRNKKQRLRSII